MVTDFHSHVLPGIDDGSQSVAESIKMLQMLSEQGITRVIATPHFYPERTSPKSFIAKRNTAEQILREEMEKHANLPEVLVGAEVYYYQGISDWDGLKDLTIGDNNCLLIEMPFKQWTVPMYQELADIYERHDLWPVIAHVDRYIKPFLPSDLPERLYDMPVYVQANASSFLHFTTRSMMLRMLEREQVNLLGSDCHNLNKRKPDMAQALKIINRHLGESALAHIQFCEGILLGESR